MTLKDVTSLWKFVLTYVIVIGVFNHSIKQHLYRFMRNQFTFVSSKKVYILKIEEIAHLKSTDVSHALLHKKTCYTVFRFTINRNISQKPNRIPIMKYNKMLWQYQVPKNFLLRIDMFKSGNYKKRPFCAPNDFYIWQSA